MKNVLVDAASPVENPAVVPKEIKRRGIVRSVLVSPRGAIAVGVLSLTIIACALSPIIAPYDPMAQNLMNASQGPSSAHWLGTDPLGRDILSRLLDGGLSTFSAVLIAWMFLLAVGVPLGLTAGYLGGKADRVITRVGEFWQSVPEIVFLLGVLAVFPNNPIAAMIALGTIAGFGLLRIIRGAALVAREELYVSAAQLMGLSKHQIMIRHILPRCRGVIVVQSSLFAAYALGMQTGLSFLGLGEAPPASSWGGMVADAANVVQVFPWYLVPPGVIIAAVALSFGILGDVVRDATAEQHSASSGRTARRIRRRAATEPSVPTTPGVLLSVRGLSVSFETARGPVTVVSDAAFDIQPGQTVALVGESGSGKSVTAKAILGLLPRNGRITGGNVMLGERDLTRFTRRDFRAVRGKRIALIAQDPMNSLDPTTRVGSLLGELVRAHDGGRRTATHERVLELLRLVQIPDPDEVARKYPHEISGGMAQRISIAMALAGRPELLIADEPTTALDVTVQAEILELLRSLQEQTGMAILLVTHDWGVVADISSRVVVMYAGQVVETADIDNLFSSPAHPYTQALIECSPDRAVPGEEIRTIPGSVPPPGSWPTGCHFQQRCSLVQADCRQQMIAIDVTDRDRSVRCLYPVDSQPLPAIDDTLNPLGATPR